MDASPVGTCQRFRERCPSCSPKLGPVVKFDFYSPHFLMNLDKNRIRNGVPSDIAGIKEV